ncbi:hypothetical protein [Halorussus caseinilyticus]|uniref:Uncharacterized protein n=1 Tax=Halorussus caseinilyticus TaxID=3034025 RepID=A0ABD5WQ10_9EURY|nr:hypothetical protein [Halorussus sp. DT72]
MVRSNRPARRWRVALLALAALAVTLVARRLRRAVARARDVPLSPLTAGWRVGADYPERRGIVADGEVAGEMDDVADYASPTFDPTALAPAVRDFYERTADYGLAYRVRWHPRSASARPSPAASPVESSS